MYASLLLAAIYIAVCMGNVYEWNDRRSTWDRTDELLQWAMSPNEWDSNEVEEAHALNEVDYILPEGASSLVEESSTTITKARNLLNEWRNYRKHIASSTVREYNL
jgi:hypothetical protein